MAARKKTAGKTAAKKKTSKKAATPKPKQAKAKGDVSSKDVNMGHVFALRPRVSTSVPVADFLEARGLLDEERYQSIEDAARAVAERALSMSNAPKDKRGRKRR
jgi:hypothetical protein